MAIDLKSISKTKSSSPPRILIHGGAKVGKSTFFSGAPNPVFIQTEDGLKGIDANAFPLCKTYSDFEDCLNALLDSPDHGYKTLVIDSLDWLESLIFDKLVTDSGKEIIIDACGGYGKAYQVATKMMSDVTKKLDKLNQSGMIIGLICHSHTTLKDNGVDQPHDINTLKLHTSKKSRGTADLFIEWVDVLGYCAPGTTVGTVKSKGVEYKRVLSSGKSNRLMLKPQPSFVAGSRYGMEDCDLRWTAFIAEFSRVLKQQQAK